MHALADRLEFAPPPTPGMVRSMGLALLAHAFLLAALTLGVQWKRETLTVTAEAELWSAPPQQAAPKLVEVAPELSTPPPVAAPLEPTPAKVDITLEREKQRLKAETLAQEKKRLQDKQAALDKKKLEQEKQRKEALQAQQDAKRLDAMRQENLKRMNGLAGATGVQGSTGTTLQSTGPSASYSGRIAAYFRAHRIGYLGTGNPKIVVRFSTSPDGTVIGKSLKVVSSSGVKAWDDAVLRALEIAVLPRDTDGRVPPDLELGLSPNDF
jgi:colicin import membrane protein